MDCKFCLESALNPNFRLLMQTMTQISYIMASCILLSFSCNDKSISVLAHSAELSQSIALRELAERFHITIQTDEETFPVRGKFGVIEATNPDPNELALYLPLFRSELLQYPREAISKSGLRKIILCKNLRANGEAAAGFADFQNHNLYLDIGVISDFPSSFMSSTIHHEIFHLMDSKQSHPANSDNSNSSWASLNEPGFRYGTDGYAKQKHPLMFEMNYALVGFLNRYSMSSIDEDKAEMFANMMLRYRKVKERTEWDDSILEAKFRQMKVLLRRFCPSFDDAFWTKISLRIAQ